MSTIKVNNIESSTGGGVVAKITNRQGKNLVTNGAMLVAERSTSSTLEGYQTIDRFTTIRSGNDQAPTMSQADIASGTTPYSLGFRKSFKVTNGNQTSGAQASSTSMIVTRLESGDMATSGWNYTSSSSYITLSFWVKASVSQNYFFSVFTQDGTIHQYTMETGALTADTWTKVTKTIPGNSNVQFDTDTLGNATARGFDIQWKLFRGTNTTGSRPLNEWAALDGASRSPASTATWYTTNNATFELTGVQLEVSDHASDFDHEIYETTLRKCQRYYERLGYTGATTDIGSGFAGSTTSLHINVPMKVTKRSTPTLETSALTHFRSLTTGTNRNLDSGSVTITASSKQSANILLSGLSGSIGDGQGGALRFVGAAHIAFVAEL